MEKKRIVIMGAAGRDFHNFNVYFRNNELYEVVAFTATQIPDIEGRKYPSELAGKLYPKGIPILAEEELTTIIREKNVDQVVFAYSDVSHEYIGHKAAVVNGAGADFILMGSKHTMLKSKVPVIAICAVRTGCGKSQTTRRVSAILKEKRKKVVAIRHPMPYGDLAKQAVQRFEKYIDLEAHACTIEEMEEYEPHLDMGNIVYAGVDYGAILQQAEKEADIVLWDGGNNDTSFYKPDLLIVVADPHRAGHEMKYYPGETNLRTADVIVINKMETADHADIQTVRKHIRAVNPGAVIIEAASPLLVENPDIVVEDGPTLTHGEMTYGAGVMAAEKYGAAEIIDPRPWVTGTIEATFKKYPGIGKLLPAMGYGDQQVKDLEQTINSVDCDAVVVGTPIDLAKIIKINKPSVRVQYKLQEIGEPTLKDVLHAF
jgi:predicted GTPase